MGSRARRLLLDVAARVVLASSLSTLPLVSPALEPRLLPQPMGHRLTSSPSIQRGLVTVSQPTGIRLSDAYAPSDISGAYWQDLLSSSPSGPLSGTEWTSSPDVSTDYMRDWFESFKDVADAGEAYEEQLREIDQQVPQGLTLTQGPPPPYP